MNVDKKYCIEITIFIYNYIMVEIIPLKIQSENLKVKNNARENFFNSSNITILFIDKNEVP